MKYRMLVWAGVWRKPVRAVLTVLSVAVAFLLFGALQGVTVGIDAALTRMSPNRMRVQSLASFREPLPLSALPQIERVSGVSDLGYVTLLGAYYREPKESVSAVAFGGAMFASKPPEFKLPKDQEATLSRTRTGAVVGAKLAEKYGWKIGDKVPLTSTLWTKRDGTAVWVFDIVGMYDVEGNHNIAQDFYFNYDYLDQDRTVAKGTVSMYVFRAADPPAVASALDRQFANSSNPTLTQSERDWIRSQVRQAGDLGLIVNAIVGAALFTLLFLTWNTMARSVRERTPELAVLKAVGFSDTGVVALIVAEAIVLCGGGALLGLAGARALFGPLSSALQAPIPMPFRVIAIGAAMALATALASSAVPSWWAKRLSVVDALAGR